MLTTTVCRATSGFAAVFAAAALIGPPADARQTAPASGRGSPQHVSHWRASTFKASAQQDASLAIDASGNIVTAWSSRRQNGGRSGVFAQWFSADGVAIGAETALSSTSVHHETGPALAADQRGGVWFVWQSHGRDGDGGSIIARHFSGDRQPGADFIVNQVVEGQQSSPHVAVSLDGTVLITWASGTGVRARWFAEDGTALGDEIAVDDTWRGGQSMPSGAFASDGSCAIIFGATEETGRPRGVRLARFDCFDDNDPDAASWRAAQPPITICDDSHRWQIEPVLAATAGGWVVAWLEADELTADYRAVAQRLALDGSLSGGRLELPGTSASWQNGLAIAAAGQGDDVVIAWNEDDSDDRGVAARRVNVAAKSMAPLPVRSVETGSQLLRQASSSPAIAVARDGSIALAWSGEGGFDDSTAAHVTLISSSPLELAGRTQGVTDGMPAAVMEDAAGAMTGDGAGLGATPHEPPIFDPEQIAREDQRRESRELGGATGFTAILSTGWNPPDPHLAVGPNHIVVMTNGAIAFFDKSGNLQFQDQIEGAAGFWGSLGATNFVFDPETLFDPLSNRYFAMASEQAPGGQSFILIAVSDDDDPNGTWHKYRFNTTSLAGATFDSPNISVDAEAVYITGDFAGASNIYPVFIYNKAAMLAGNPTTAENSLTISTSTESAGIPPVSFDDPPALYMVEHKESASNTQVRLIALEDGLGTPVVSSLNITVPSYTPPEDPPQMGTSIRPETFDARFWSAAYRNGSLWATHHVGNTRVLARWYEFAMNGWPASGRNPALVQSGTIDPGPTIRTFFSAITVDDFGNAGIVVARSAASEFISMATAYRDADDPPGTFQPSIIQQSSNAAYTAVNRWGDYSAINVDPSDGLTMWAHHEYALSNVWRTWVQEIIPPITAPANDLCANASAIGEGITAFSTVDASTDGPDEAEACGGASPLGDVWFRYTATCSGQATVALCGSSFDAAIAVYGSTCPDAPGQLIACAGSSIDCFDQQPFVTFDVVSGQQYLLRIGSESAASGGGDVLVACQSPVCPADLTGDSEVGPADLGALLAAWNTDPGGPPDFDLSGNVGPEDLATLLAGWGDCP